MKKLIMIIVLVALGSQFAFSQVPFEDKVELAKTQFDNGHYAKAIKTLDKLIRDTEKGLEGTDLEFFQELMAEAYLIRAKSNIKLKSSKNVCEDLETAIRLKVDEAYLIAKESCPSIITTTMESEYNFEIASKYFWDENYQEALPYLNKAIELNPYDDFILGYRALSYGLLGKFEEALRDYNKMIELTGDPDHYAKRGSILFRLQRFEESLSDLNKAVQSDSANSIYFIERGMILSALSRHQDAITDFNQASIELSLPVIFLERAKCYLALGDKERACKDLKEIEVADRTEEIRALLKDCKD